MLKEINIKQITSDLECNLSQSYDITNMIKKILDTTEKQYSLYEDQVLIIFISNCAVFQKEVVEKYVKSSLS